MNRRTVFSILAVSGLAAAAAGCNDTKQPTSSPVQTATLSFIASGQMDTYDCWELWIDTDNDGRPDQDTFQVSCTQRFQPMSTNPEQHPVNIPWHYSLAISVIRTGQTEEQLVAASIIPGD